MRSYCYNMRRILILSTLLVVGVQLLSAFPVNDYQRVSFRHLRLYMPGAKPPKMIEDLHNKRVEVLGFMAALTQLEDIDEFLLASAPPMNCFCHPPMRVNDLILVKMKGTKTVDYKNGVVKARGRLEINFDVRDEFADVMYTLHCEEVL